MTLEPKLKTSSAGLPCHASSLTLLLGRELPAHPLPPSGRPQGNQPSRALLHLLPAAPRPAGPGLCVTTRRVPASFRPPGHHRGTAACCSPDGRGQSGPASLSGWQQEAAGGSGAPHPAASPAGASAGWAGAGSSPGPFLFPPGPVPGGRWVRQRRPPSGRGGGARLLTNLRSASGSRSRKGWRSQTPPGGCHPGPARGLARSPLPAARAAEPGQRRSSRPEPGGRRRRGAPEVAFNSERRELQGMRGGRNKRERKKK